MPEWLVYSLLVLTLIIGYLLATLIDRYTKFFKRISSWIIVPLPFIVLFLIGIPLLLFKVDFDIIFYCCSFPFLFFCGVSIAVYIERYIIWRERKLEKAKIAQGVQNKDKK
ncbi:hypothetical protein [Mycoplasma elephantis]|uniref:hypothetical protein n=1 Tax=Mycoplasma elephantis TaxID=114882 RepID=UPI000480D340|nr:hypothetical protein [Mycoplasma elephantis]